MSCFQRWPSRVGGKGGVAGCHHEAVPPRHSAQRKAHSAQAWHCAMQPGEQTSGRSERPGVWRWAEGKSGLKSSMSPSIGLGLMYVTLGQRRLREGGIVVTETLLNVQVIVLKG